MKLSATMADALDHAIAGGGLKRLAGGFWVERRAEVRWNGGQPATWCTGSSTVAALEKRGLVKFSEWMDGRRGRFPVSADPA